MSRLTKIVLFWLLLILGVGSWYALRERKRQRAQNDFNAFASCLVGPPLASRETLRERLEGIERATRAERHQRLMRRRVFRWESLSEQNDVRLLWPHRCRNAVSALVESRGYAAFVPAALSTAETLQGVWARERWNEADPFGLTLAAQLIEHSSLFWANYHPDPTIAPPPTPYAVRSWRVHSVARGPEGVSTRVMEHAEEPQIGLARDLCTVLSDNTGPLRAVRCRATRARAEWHAPSWLPTEFRERQFRWCRAGGNTWLAVRPQSPTEFQEASEWTVFRYDGTQALPQGVLALSPPPPLAPHQRWSREEPTLNCTEQELSAAWTWNSDRDDPTVVAIGRCAQGACRVQQQTLQRRIDRAPEANGWNTDFYPAPVAVDLFSSVAVFYLRDGMLHLLRGTMGSLDVNTSVRIADVATSAFRAGPGNDPLEVYARPGAVLVGVTGGTTEAPLQIILRVDRDSVTELPLPQ